MLQRSLLILALVTSAYSNSCPTEITVPRFEQGYPVDENQMMGAYNAPSFSKTAGCYKTFIKADFLLWQPKQQGLSIATITPAGDATDKNSNILNMDFDFDPGFRVSIGTSLRNDGWIFVSKYTHLYSKNSVNKSVQGDDSIQSHWERFFNFTDVKSIKGSWDLYFHMLDFLIGRPCFVGTKLAFMPFAGLKPAFIYQRLMVNLVDNDGDNVTTNITNINSDSWLIGPEVGVNTTYLFGDGFKMFGNFLFSIFYQDFDLSIKEHDVGFPALTKIDNKVGDINSSFECSIGFGWGRYFRNNNIYLDLLAGYDLSIFWNQNMLRYFSEKIAISRNSKPGNLTPHGFSFAVSLDF